MKLQFIAYTEVPTLPCDMLRCDEPGRQSRVIILLPCASESSLNSLLRPAFRTDVPTCMQKFSALNHNLANGCLACFRGFPQFHLEYIGILPETGPRPVYSSLLPSVRCHSGIRCHIIWVLKASFNKQKIRLALVMGLMRSWPCHNKYVI